MQTNVIHSDDEKFSLKRQIADSRKQSMLALELGDVDSALGYMETSLRAEMNLAKFKFEAFLVRAGKNVDNRIACCK